MSKKSNLDRNHRKPYGHYSVNGWGCVENITKAAISRGQFPLAIFAAIILVILIRYPKDQLPVLVDNFFGMLENLWILGYVFWVVTVMLWVVFSWIMRSETHREQKRIGIEKTRLQEAATGVNLGTSS